MTDLLTWFRSHGERECACEPRFEADRLVVDADACEHGNLTASPDCRAAAVRALRSRDADTIVVREGGAERRYADRATALLLAAGRFAERVALHDERLADRTACDPLAAAGEAAGRAGPVADAAATTGFTEVAADLAGYDEALRSFVGPTIARSRIDPDPPPEGRLEATRTLDTDATVRVYAVPDRELRVYHLEPVETRLDPAACSTLAAARDRLAAGDRAGSEIPQAAGGEASGDGRTQSPNRAVRAVIDGDPVADPGTLADVLRKHTRGYGVLEDLFADEAVTDVFASAPAGGTPLRVRADGESLRTNVSLTRDGAAALASRLRRESGRAFSRAAPTLDAVADLATGEEVRAAGLTEPASDGYGFAFRTREDVAWTLPALVANGTLSPPVAALLSLAVERAAALLVAGARGAGKTTLLGALAWELPAATRLVVIEDTPELPVDALCEHGRDVQAMRTDPDGDRGLAPAAALRAALRLGESALVVGEVRGEEAAVLYEAMRVGAGGSAVLGTVHGEGGAGVRERVVSDLGVDRSAFGATDLVVTLAARETQTRTERGVTAVEEVLPDGEGTAFADLARPSDDGSRTALSDRVERGNSRLLATLAGDDETYSTLLDRLRDRASFLDRLAERDATDPAAVVTAHARRRASTARATPERRT